VTEAAGVGDPDRTYRTSGVAWGDFDGDGLLDLLVVRHLDESDPAVLFSSPRNLSPAVRALALYRNRGNGTFTDVTAWLGDAAAYPSKVKGAGFTPAFVDYDNDGRPDIYVVNDFGVANHPNVLWRNDGSDGRGGWKFTDVSRQSGADLAIYGMGLAVADYDHDGHLDLYTSDIGPSKLLRGRGDGTFVEVAEAAGVGRGVVPDPAFPDNRSIGWGVAFLDYDNDGWRDLYLVAGFMDAEPSFNLTRQPNALFRNRGDGTFEDVSAGSGVDDDGAGREVVAADFDGDGRLDLYLVNIGTRAENPGVSHLFLNRVPQAGNWLAVKPVGTRSNRDGVGTRVEVRAGGLTGAGVMGERQGHVSHSVVPVHFGLGAATRATVTVRWPSGAVQTFADIPANRLLTVVEP
jgi:enediyne biosynthesis protein E4